ncbi:hypothetical protein C2845_PM09G15740 [Panicum miliaceum]|uniref:Uncharacterized protein n=1 Tax=Panicum miliaceum TaxID=4540 RepID=A0A3L6RZJ1_PANMI|nr:hypothetical protein C2845_PM09G15740 [Panicum miliaceum]
MRVVDLLSPCGRRWDDAALNRNLIDADAPAMKQIPLGRSREDFWAWSGERHGNYSVLSTYRLLAEQEAQLRNHGDNRASYSATNADPR